MTYENMSSSGPSAGDVDSKLDKEKSWEEAVKRVVGAIEHLDNDAIWFANSLADFLNSLAPISRSPLTKQRKRYLIESGAFTAEQLEAATSDVAKGALQLRVAETFLSHVCETMSLEIVIGYLGWDEKAVRTAISEGRLYAVEITGRLRFPHWQFNVGRPSKFIPGLTEIIAAVTPRWEWGSAAAFMSTPQTDLVTMGRQTPAEFLRSGGDVKDVTDLIEASDWH